LKDGMKFDLSSTDAIKNLLQTAITEMAFGYKYWEEHYTMLLEKIMELNPDATIVMVGSFNVVNQLTINDDLIFPLGTLFSTITDGMNRHYRQWEKKYGVIYCDIANTETLAAENDWSLLGDFKSNTFTGTHPSQKGYDYIVRQILSVLPEENTSKNLRIDLGRFTKVDEVYINGIKVKDFTMDGFILEIPYSKPLSGELIIKSQNDDGTTSAQVYTLVWRAGKGVSAYRVWGTNDLIGKVLSPFRLIVKLVKMLYEKVSGLIKK
nr:SGNH/GDSL hydrolase family protein [Clostridiales bacterium]